MSKNRNTFHNIHNKSSQWGLAILIIVLFFSLQPAPAVHAAGIVVTSGSGDDLNVNDGICTLREAVTNANLPTGGDGTGGDCVSGDAGIDTITIPAGTYTLAIASTGENGNLDGDLDITDNIIINGGGAGITTINGGGIDRVIHTVGTSIVTINNLTITGGQIGTLGDPSSSGSFGGGIYRQSSGNMTLTGVTISNNLAGHRGGGLENGNIAGILTLINCIISGNESDWGGGIVSGNLNTTTIINNSTFSNNTAHDHGGGLNIYDGAMTVNNSTFTGNHGPGNGAAMASRDTLTVNNSTITGNATAGNGDGIYTYDGGATTVSNSIVSDNGTDNCNVAVINGGNNLEYPGTTCGGFTVQTDPLLGTLTNNGGDTQTHALGIGSPAIDAGDCSSSPALDQRDLARPTDTTCDIGAFELQSYEIAEQDCTGSAPLTLPNANVSITAITSGTPGCFSATKQSVFPGLVQTTGEFEIVWRLSTENTPFDMNLRLCYTAGELTTSGVSDETTIVAYRWNESTHAWMPQTTTPDINNNCVDVANVTEFSAWTLAGAGSPPTAVSLQSITATSQPTSWIILLFSVLMLTIGGVWLRRVKR